MLPSTHNWDMNSHDETTWSPWPIPWYILFAAYFHGRVYHYPETQIVALQFSAESKNSANRVVTLFHRLSRHSSIIRGLLPLQKSQIMIISMPCFRNCQRNNKLVCSCVPHGYPSALLFEKNVCAIVFGLHLSFPAGHDERSTDQCMCV